MTLDTHNLNEMLLQASQAAKLNGQRAIEVLEDNSQLPADAFTQQLANTLAYPYLTLTQMLALQPAFDRISFSESLQNECVLLHDVSLHGNNANIFVFADIYNQRLQTWAAERIGGAFTTYLAHHADIAAYLAKQEEDTRTVQKAIGHVALTKNEAHASEELSLNMIEGDASPVIKLVRSTLYDALKAEASDIHLETAPTGLVIKYRLDGVLSQVGAISDPKLAEQVISRIKVISELDITEQRVPQDGRFRSVYRGRDVDFRVSVMPSIHGEDVVIRVLDKQTLADKASGLRLDVLGFDAASMQTMREQFTLPYGMVLVTGTTGSGKTTTLYAAISEINNSLLADLIPDNLRLQKAIQTAIDAQLTQDTSVGLYIHRNQQPKPYYLSISRLKKQLDERREGHSALIIIKDLELNYERWAERLKKGFNMSPREIQCVVLLTERRSVQEVAEVMAICTETVRQYLKSVFKKMDVRKLHELVSLALEYRRNR